MNETSVDKVKANIAGDETAKTTDASSKGKRMTGSSYSIGFPVKAHVELNDPIIVPIFHELQC